MKNIVICCDGTGNDLSGAPSNVLRFFRSLKRDESQLTYYDSGVGTLADPSMITDPGKAVAKQLDMATGHSVKRQVCTAYRFLTRNLSAGDKIYLNGFSRGAYAVRALAGMIHLLGLPQADAEHLDELAWAVYSSADFKACANFKHAFSRETAVDVHFVGAWDTVSSFGWITNFKTLPHTANNPSIRHVRHAVAIHEKRACFKSNLFFPNESTGHESFSEQWFDGAHSDVGGGYPEEESGLAKVALEWMFAEAAECGCQFKPDRIEYYLGRSASRTFQCQPDPNGKPHQSIRGFWHLLEFLPRRQWNHDADPGRMTWYFPNLYRPRKIPADAQFHPSVDPLPPA